MAGVNLRVATLKNSNLRNCDLRGAILAGTDLEVPLRFESKYNFTLNCFLHHGLFLQTESVVTPTYLRKCQLSTQKRFPTLLKYLYIVLQKI